MTPSPANRDPSGGGNADAPFNEDMVRDQAPLALDFLQQVRQDINAQALADTSREDDTQTNPASLDATTESDNLPSTLGRFQLIRLLGEGGFAKVFLARDPLLDRLIALKVLRQRETISTDTAKRFDREARASAVLSHPNIVPVFESGEADGVRFIATEYCKGPTLHAWLKSANQPLDPKLAATIVRDLAQGIEHAHQRGIAHRDLKPSNILFAEKAETSTPDLPGRPLISDFGLAQVVADDNQALTVEGVVVGTPLYMSPEQARGKVSNGKSSDIYSLGVIFYELLTGVQPLVGDDPVSTLLLVANTPPKSPRSQRPEIPRDLEAICLRCLEKEPNDRYATAFEIAEDIDRWSTGRPVEARTANVIERCSKWCRRNPVHCLAMTLITLAMIFATVQWIAADRQRLRAEQQAERSERNIALAGRAIRELATRTVQSPEIPLVIRKTLGQQALDFQLQLLEEDPEDANLVFQAALLWNNVAWNLHDERHFEDSIAATQKSDALLEQIPTSNKKMIALQNSNRTLKASNQQLLGQFKEALQTLQFSLNADEPAYAVAARLDQQGYTLHNSGQLKKARDAFLQSVLVWENSGARKNLFSKAGLAESLHGLAWMQFELGEYKKALANLTDAQRIHRELNDVIPFHENFEEQVTRVHLLLGRTQLKLKQYDQASRHLQSAIKRFGQLREWNQEMPRYLTQELLAREQHILLFIETDQLRQIANEFTHTLKLFELLPDSTVDRAEKGQKLLRLLLQFDDAIKNSAAPTEHETLPRDQWLPLATQLSELVDPVLPQDSLLLQLQARIKSLQETTD